MYPIALMTVALIAGAAIDARAQAAVGGGSYAPEARRAIADEMRAAAAASAYTGRLAPTMAAQAELARAHAGLDMARHALAPQLARQAAELAAVSRVRAYGYGRAMAAPRFTSSAPAPWIVRDTADSLYRLARTALNRNNFRDAAAKFREIRQRYPKSGYVADSYYYEAFALYRMSGDSNLKTALARLEEQAREHPEAATRGDADALTTRIQGALARGGNSEAARAITEEAASAAEAPAAPVAVGGARPARPSRAPRPARATRRGDDCDDEDDIKLMALNGLMQMDAEQALPTLKKVLARRDSGSVCLRRRAMFIVSQKQSPETADILLSAARNDPDSEVRGQAIFWLSQVDSERAVPALDSILRSSPDRELQEKALFAISQQRSDRAARILRSYAEREDVDDEMRGKAIFWIGQEGGAENAAYMRSLYAKVKSEEVKEKIIFGLSQSHDGDNGRWLLDLARNTGEPIELRKKALFWAGQSSSLATKDLAGLYETMPDREMRQQLIFSLSQRNDSAAMDKLIDIARRDSDPELRRNALFWIGQSKDPRATQLLQDILEKE